MKHESEVKHRGVFEREPGSGIWWIHWFDGKGQRHREKVGSKSAAMKLYQKRKTEVLEGKKLPELRPRVVTFGEIAAEALAYSRVHNRDHAGDKCRMARPLTWWRDRAADSISPDEIEAQLSGAMEWSDGTRNRVHSVISVAYKLAIRGRKLKENPARLFPARPERNIRQGFITDMDYSKLVQADPPLWLRTMLAVGYNFGWRAGELTALKVRQVDIKARTLRLEPGTTKNSQGRTIFLDNECLQLLAACIGDKQPEIPVLTRESGGPILAYRFDWERLCVRAGLGRFVCKKCGTQGNVNSAAGRPCPDCRKMRQSGVYKYEGLLFHDLRRSAVRNMERAGVSRSTAMKITGHETEAVYRRYAIVSEADMAEAVRRLEQMRQNSEIEQPPKQPPAATSGMQITDKVM